MSDNSFPTDALLHCIQLRREIIISSDKVSNYYRNMYNKALIQLKNFNGENNLTTSRWNSLILELQKEDLNEEEINNLFLKAKELHNNTQHLKKSMVDNEKSGLSRFYGVSCSEEEESAQKKPEVTLKDENQILMACVYSCCILHDEKLPFTIENIQKILTASNLKVPDIYCQLISTFLNSYKQPLQNAINLSEYSTQNVAPPYHSFSNEAPCYGIPLHETHESEESEGIMYGINFWDDEF
ncbi:hypothetical protein ABK040_001736 [Willaertia magna]